jgi:hypothetical protein
LQALAGLVSPEVMAESVILGHEDAGVPPDIVKEYTAFLKTAFTEHIKSLTSESKAYPEELRVVSKNKRWLGWYKGLTGMSSAGVAFIISRHLKEVHERDGDYDGFNFRDCLLSPIAASESDVINSIKKELPRVLPELFKKEAHVVKMAFEIPEDVMEIPDEEFMAVPSPAKSVHLELGDMEKKAVVPKKKKKSASQVEEPEDFNPLLKTTPVDDYTEEQKGELEEYVLNKFKSDTPRYPVFKNFSDVCDHQRVKGLSLPYFHRMLLCPMMWKEMEEYLRKFDTTNSQRRTIWEAYRKVYPTNRGRPPKED